VRAHQGLERDQVASALAKETGGESMPKSMRRNGFDPGSPADAANHPAERLLGSGLLRVEPMTDAFSARHPTFDLDGEDVILGAGRDLLQAVRQRCACVGGERKRVPVLSLAQHLDPPPGEIDVLPAAGTDFRVAKPNAFEKHDRGQLMQVGRRPESCELLVRRARDLRLALRWPPDAGARIGVD
jgi:hypothetical protein